MDREGKTMLSTWRSASALSVLDPCRVPEHLRAAGVEKRAKDFTGVTGSKCGCSACVIALARRSIACLSLEELSSFGLDDEHMAFRREWKLLNFCSGSRRSG